MSQKSKIEWTGATWNPIRALDLVYALDPTGAAVQPAKRWGYHCEHVSEGCRNCYAERMNARLLPAWGTGLEYTRQNRDKVQMFLDEEALTQPLRWQKPRRIFPCSMTDLFADFVPDTFIDQVFAVMTLCPQHTFQVLTKRPNRMMRYLLDPKRHEPIIERLNDIIWPRDQVAVAIRWPLPNVWFGVSVEDQRTADERIPLLLETPAAVRWVSYEPALGAVDFEAIPQCMDDNEPSLEQLSVEHPYCARYVRHGAPGIDWIVVGGESGPGARPFDVAWARQTIRQCRQAGVACFVKQLGSKPYYMRDGNRILNVGPVKFALDLKDRKGGGDMAEWPEDLRVREYPEVSLMSHAPRLREGGLIVMFSLHRLKCDVGRASVFHSFLDLLGLEVAL